MSVLAARRGKENVGIDYLTLYHMAVISECFCHRNGYRGSEETKLEEMSTGKWLWLSSNLKLVWGLKCRQFKVLVRCRHELDVYMRVA